MVIGLPQRAEPLVGICHGGEVMLEPDRGIEQDVTPRLTQTQRIEHVIAVDEQRSVRIAHSLDRLARDEQPHKRSAVHRAIGCASVIDRIQVKTVTPLAPHHTFEGPPHHAFMPERIERGPVHIANPPVGVIHRRRPRRRRAAVCRPESRHRPRCGTRIIVHHQNPVRIKLGHGKAHARLEPACPATVDRTALHHQTRIILRGQPRCRAIGGGVVDHDHTVQPLGRCCQQARYGHLQLVKPVVCHHNRHKAVRNFGRLLIHTGDTSGLIFPVSWS